jgi:hypothetical protein
MKYAVAFVLLVTLAFAADNNVSQKKPFKKVYPKGTIATH